MAFIKLNETPEVQNLNASDKVYINSNGTTKQINLSTWHAANTPTCDDILPEATTAGSALVWNGQEWTTASGYASRRIDTLLEDTITISDGVVEGDPINLIIGEKYTVVWNGTTYTNMDVVDDTENQAKYIGDPSCEDYPFLIVNSGLIMTSSDDGDYTVKILGPVKTFIDINYTNSNAKNGTGNNSTVEGELTTASGYNSHAEGSETTASGLNSHAEGDKTKASNNCAHAEGNWSEANGVYSHAEGSTAKANGRSSHAEGECTIATSNYSHAEGKFNIEDANNKYAHIIGNGTSYNDRHNCFMVGWDGAIYVQASNDSSKMMKITVNSNGQISATQVVI